MCINKREIIIVIKVIKPVDQPTDRREKRIKQKTNKPTTTKTANFLSPPILINKTFNISN